ncbi:MAG: hypothetical protein P8181_11015, partial [bacterium]
YYETHQDFYYPEIIIYSLCFQNFIGDHYERKDEIKDDALSSLSEKELLPSMITRLRYGSFFVGGSSRLCADTLSAG